MEAQAAKPYELKALGDKIIAKAKADGLTLAEEAVEKLAKACYLGTKEWLQDSAAASSTKIDDVVVSFIGYADPYVLPQIAKIDLDGDGK